MKRESTDNSDRAMAALAPLALRPRDAAAALGIGRRKLWELTNRGEIPCVRVGRSVIYPVCVIESWLAEKAKGGAPWSP